MIINTEVQTLLDQFQAWVTNTGTEISTMSTAEVSATLFDLAGGNQGNPPGLGYPQRGHMYQALDYLIETNFLTHNKPDTMKKVEPLLPPGVGTTEPRKQPDEPTVGAGRVVPYFSPELEKFFNK